ncbi:hypothetical protein [Streptomyces sp. NBC_01174]|uniref:hypothetical protein n=1 Tax=Streptomyces sp. NBC_01174 TaxID=2903758 RepID=UPI002F90C376|nr:hypothetical protein OG414_40790 [Streptomyces sp. NBC_01174]
MRSGEGGSGAALTELDVVSEPGSAVAEGSEGGEAVGPHRGRHGVVHGSFGAPWAGALPGFCNTDVGALLSSALS